MVYNQRNHNLTLHKATTTSRLLCECELYAPPNYDNDPEMKELMEIFNRQTSERLREYDERMQDKRQKCKEQCEKDIQKIILKDKIEKELSEKLGALQTDIRTEDIPTCVCEKSVAAKTEKVCLKCGKTMGAVAPAWGLVSGVGYVAWTQYVATTVAKAATDAGIAEGVKVGLINVAKIVTQLSKGRAKIPVIDAEKLITVGKFSDGVSLDGIFKAMDIFMLKRFDEGTYGQFSLWVQNIAKTPRIYMSKYPTEVAEVTKAFAEAKTSILTKAGNATSSLTTAITASIIAIILIVFVMIIIYLILRYRRKKKMKRKLQYMKLLKE
ncbi:hypothetical protein PFUGPA_00656 [Plasmodium falciparum Palo Alto/Uganda]|uniref:Rifin n=1 Tax=Plasmodium falciparum (isolate Palo Alto / Uganda) TaxID=57270 RepID=W4J5M6_PLAFP|nr:hypothetical protein PFUGPA_00656 [Plasmodium falciparum Palo Alto/Uganda]